MALALCRLRPSRDAMGRMLSAPVLRPCSKPAGSRVRRRYERHCPEETILYGVVERHHGELFAQLGEEGRRVPGFVRTEFEAVLSGYAGFGETDGFSMRWSCRSEAGDGTFGVRSTKTGMYWTFWSRGERTRGRPNGFFESC